MQRLLNKNKRKYSELQNYIQTSETSLTCIFTEAEEYPSFFNENLIDSDRTIKLFYQQPYAHQTVFYFQLLKLIYQTDQNDYEKYLVKIYDLIDNPEFEMEPPPIGHYYHVNLSDMKMKRMIQEFLEQLGTGQAGVSQMLAKYPIMDKIFVIFIRTILLLGQMCESFEQKIQSVEIYQFLADYFEVDVTYYTNCIRFNLTDIFVYFEAPSEIYMAFITPKESQQCISVSQEYYNSEVQEPFNISSVHQMVSEIDIGGEEAQKEIFDISKQVNESQYIQYDYSHSQDVKQNRRPSKSIQQCSEFKLSCLGVSEDSIMNSSSAIISNKILEKQFKQVKQVFQDRKNILKNNKSKEKCFKIEQVPLQIQNACSPLATPRGTSYVEKGNDQNRRLSKYSYKDNINDHITFADTGESFREDKPTRKTENQWQNFKKQAQMLFGEEQESQYKARTQKNLKNLYEMRSIKTIISCNDSQSCYIDTPNARSNFVTSFNSFNPSFQPSRKITAQGLFHQNVVYKPNGYTKFGYVNNNISTEFTNSILLKQLGEPYRSHISGVKTRARKERTHIQNMIKF